MFDKKEKELAQNSTDPEELDRLAMNNSDAVKIIVAQNPHTSAKTLKSLALNASIKPTIAAIYNPNIPLEVLEFLSGSKPSVKGPDLMAALFVDVFVGNMVNINQFNMLLVAHYALVNLLKRTGKL